MDVLNSFLALLGLSTMSGKIAWGISIITAIYAWYTKNKEKIQAIILRIEKERTDEQGWTHEEKEQLALDVFFAEIYPKFPVWIRMIPFVKTIIEKIIRNIIKKFCKKSSDIKGTVKTIVNIE